MPNRIIGIAIAILVALFLLGTLVVSNIKYANEGTVQVVTFFGQIERVYAPKDGWFTTLMPGREAHEVNIRSFTETAPVRVTSRDNAALMVDVSVTASTNATMVEDYVRKFGFREDERHRRRNEILKGIVQTEARKAFSQHGAYDIYGVQEEIQTQILASLSEQLDKQLLLVTESVQLGNPDFLDDQIEKAASGVVANEKLKMAEEAKLAAARISAETKKIEALMYADPALLQIKLLELRLQIEEARAKGIQSHQGSLTVVYDNPDNMALTLPAQAGGTSSPNSPSQRP